MGSIERRLERLESRTTWKRGRHAASASQRAWERYFHAHENARRELDGLEPLSELPYTEEDREDDQRTLEQAIPAAREDPAWQTRDAKAFLDEWERDLRDRLRKEG